MTRRRLLSIMLVTLTCAVCGQHCASAGPMGYRLTATSFSGAAYGLPGGVVPLPAPSITFIYDTGTAQFTEFSVVWADMTFDMMVAAEFGVNKPAIVGTAPCLNGATGAALVFAYLAGSCSRSDVAFTVSATENFDLLFQLDPSQNLGVLSTAFPGVPGAQAWLGDGTFAATATPEPSGLLLCAAGLLAMAGFRRTLCL
jgi:hypothetical protein